MKKIIFPLLLLTLMLGACSPVIPSPETLPVNPTDTSASNTPTDPTPEIQVEFPTMVPPNPKIIMTVETPNIGQPPDVEIPSPTISSTDCGYQWAYNDIPDLTTQFDQAVKSLNSNSSAHATAFGENCFGPDGQIVRFVAMETDFYVTLTVPDLSDRESFGNWIAQVMLVINDFPPDMLSGPNPGFVEFKFEKNEMEFINVRVPIQKYNSTANGKTGGELFQTFYVEP